MRPPVSRCPFSRLPFSVCPSFFVFLGAFGLPDTHNSRYTISLPSVRGWKFNKEFFSFFIVFPPARSAARPFRART